MRHFLTLQDFSKDEILEILNLAVKIKAEAKAKSFIPYLKNQKLGMIFEKSSTRTRVSFEVGMYELGGTALFLSSNDIQLGRGEEVKDTARVLSSMLDMVMIRTYAQSKIEEFAKYSSIPIINALTDKFHPMQLLADYLTIMELRSTENLSVAYIGDGNNMANSWIVLASKLGFKLNIATPKGYEPDSSVLEQNKGDISFSNDPQTAVKDVDVVTTDTWISMGQESQKEQKMKEFDGFIVDEKLMSLAKNDALFLHCLPAYKGYEVSENVFESHLEIFKEAENRLHAQKAVMVWLDSKRR